MSQLCDGGRLGVEFRLQSKVVEGFWDAQAEGSYGIKIGDEISHVNGAAVENELEFVSAFLQVKDALPFTLTLRRPLPAQGTKL